MADGAFRPPEGSFKLFAEDENPNTSDGLIVEGFVDLNSMFPSEYSSEILPKVECVSVAGISKE
jgi:hypothetical protein